MSKDDTDKKNNSNNTSNTSRSNSYSDQYSSTNTSKYNSYGNNSNGNSNNIIGSQEYYLQPPPLSGWSNYEHNVYSDTSISSTIVGYLIPGVRISVREICNHDNNWLYVKYHNKNYNLEDEDLNVLEGFGWTQKNENKHDFLKSCDEINNMNNNNKTDGNTNNKNSNSYSYDGNKKDIYNKNDDDFEDDDDDEFDEEEDWKEFLNEYFPDQSSAFYSNSETNKNNLNKNNNIWYQKHDDNGNIYYYNPATLESQWHSPEWVEETDESTGLTYYVKLNTVDGIPLHSTWTRPTQFATLIREEK
jgi:hypothetical protein